jgi:hypothetical protein
MIEYLALVILIICMAIAYILLFAVVCMEIKKLINLISSNRKDRKIFKSAERCRRDFT